MTKNKVWENRLRRKAERQGMKLHKVRRYDPDARDYGTYYLSDIELNSLVFPPNFGESHVGADLEEIEDFLTGEWEEQEEDT